MEETETKRKPYYQQNVEKVYEAVKNSTAPFVTGEKVEKDVLVKPQTVIRSLETGKAYKGINQLVAQISLNEMSKTDSTVLTYEQAQKMGTGIKKGGKSIVLTSYDYKAEEGKQSKVYHLFPTSSAVFNEAIEKKLAVVNKRNKENQKNIVIENYETDPEKYIGKYLAACQLGATMKTNDKTIEEFKSNFINSIGKEIEKGHHTALFETGKKANDMCKKELISLVQKQQEKGRDYSRHNSPEL